MNKNYLFIIGGIIVAIFIFSQMKKEVLGSTNWPSDCSFITNVNPYTQRPTSYASSGAWIAIDYNSDGIKEKFGMVSSSTSPGQASWATLVENYNNYGDDIKTNGVSVYVVYGSGYTRFNLNEGSASNAVTTCGVCTPSCIGKTCGDDGCGGSCGSCSTGYTCTNNQCVQVSTCPSAICNDDIVSYDEAISVLNKWISG